jgi:hypothetical protein
MGAILFGLVIAGILLLLLARYAPSAAARRLERRVAIAGRDPRPPMSAASLHALVRDLLTIGMGLELLLEEVQPDGSRMQLCRRGPIADVIYSVLVVAAPEGEIVDQARIVELMQTTAALRSRGMLITPYRIDTSGFGDLPEDLELIDGPRLQALVARYLPTRSRELGTHRLAPTGV